MLRYHRSTSECSNEKSREYQYLYKLSSHNRDAWNCAAKIEIRSRNDHEIEVETERGTMKRKEPCTENWALPWAQGFHPSWWWRSIWNRSYSSSLLFCVTNTILLPLPISDFWFPILNRKNNTATLGLTTEGENTERRRSNSFPCNGGRQVTYSF